ncbi:MAG: ABC transporter substrate-binding protein, partial [Dehalococcoidia bacterium]|nr:ABC transporter substrate-binding protein [Dehalococcoidia bacterium]
MKRLIALLLIALVSVILVVTGCAKEEKSTTPAGQATQQAQVKYGGTLKVIYPYMGTSLGWPATSRGGYSFYQIMCLEPLLEQTMDGTIIPRLATGYQIGDDNSITFTLRKGVKFHDGTPFNAEAVKFNFDAMKAEKKGATVNWASVDVVDDYHVKVTYANWTNWVISDFTHAGALYIVSPTAYQKNGLDWMKNHMVGTGPFVQTDWEQDVSVKFEKNKDYWQKGKPYVDRLEIICVVDPVTAQTTILSGGADILNSEADQKVVDMRAKGLQAITRPVGVINIFPDSANADSPLANKKLREAIEYAINKEAIA